MTTEVLTVPTAFGDLSELSEGLADRVDEERIILYGPTPYDEGELIGFSVLLVDGTPALEGVGRVAAAVDGGDERAPETRFDIVFDSLQLDGRSEVVYERIVLARSSLYGTDPATGEVSIEELEAQSRELEAPPSADLPDDRDEVSADAPAEVFASFDEGDDASADVGDVAFSEPPPAPVSVRPPASIPPAAPASIPPESVRPSAPVDEVYDDEGAYDDAGFEADSGSTMVADLEQLRAAAQPTPSLAPAPALPSAPPGFVLQAPPGGVLTRPMAPPTWWPEATAPAQPRPSTGWFQYGDTLPIPSAAPRPELDPTQRVARAPRPGDALQPPSPPSVMPPMMVGRVEEPEEAPAYMSDAPYEADDQAPAEASESPNDGYGEEPESVEADASLDDADDWSGVDLDGDEDLAGDTRHAVELPEDER
jgi:hypothetical protein